MKTTRHQPWRCTRCGYVMDSSTSAAGDDAVPEENDVTVCIDCTEPHIMHGGKFVELTDDELIDMPLEQKQQMSKVQLAIREFHQQNKKSR